MCWNHLELFGMTSKHVQNALNADAIFFSTEGRCQEGVGAGRSDSEEDSDSSAQGAVGCPYMQEIP